MHLTGSRIQCRFMRPLCLKRTVQLARCSVRGWYRLGTRPLQPRGWRHGRGLGDSPRAHWPAAGLPCPLPHGLSPGPHRAAFLPRALGSYGAGRGTRSSAAQRRRRPRSCPLLGRASAHASVTDDKGSHTPALSPKPRLPLAQKSECQALGAAGEAVSTHLAASVPGLGPDCVVAHGGRSANIHGMDKQRRVPEWEATPESVGAYSRFLFDTKSR